MPITARARLRRQGSCPRACARSRIFSGNWIMYDPSTLRTRSPPVGTRSTVLRSSDGNYGQRSDGWIEQCSVLASI